MSTEDKVTQGLPKSFNKSYFDLIKMSSCIIDCVSTLHMHSQDSMNPKDDIHHAQLYLQKFSPYDDLEIDEKHMTKKTMEKDASPFAPFDPILHCAKTFQKGGSWAMPPNLS